MGKTIYTIGHSLHPLPRLLELLRPHGVARVADVRTAPYSKHAPWYRKRPLATALQQAGLAYVHVGGPLGGLLTDPRYLDADGEVVWARRAAEPDFVAALERLVELAREAVTVLLCAEENPSRCHRRMMLAPALAELGLQVVHLRGDGEAQTEQELLAAEQPQLSLF